MIIEGEIVAGKQQGRTLGFPTANIRPDFQEGSDADGVYAAWIQIDEMRLPCMVNIGDHPTLPGGGKTVEAHIFDFSGDLYGRKARLETVAFLRGEVRFSCADALRDQLTRDAETARRFL